MLMLKRELLTVLLTSVSLPCSRVTRIAVPGYPGNGNRCIGDAKVPGEVCQKTNHNIIL